METLRTPRLTLRPLQWSDFSWFAALHADPAVARYLGDGKPRDEAATRRWMEDQLALQRDGLGHNVIVERETERVVGRAGLSVYEMEVAAGPEGVPRVWWGPGSAPDGVASRAELEIGYAVHPAAQGRGIATEAARAVRDHALGELRARRAISLVYPQNRASRRVAEKNGMELDGEVDGWGTRLVVYAIQSGA